VTVIRRRPEGEEFGDAGGGDPATALIAAESAVALIPARMAGNRDRLVATFRTYAQAQLTG
jgi:hypothetical protein